VVHYEDYYPFGLSMPTRRMDNGNKAARESLRNSSTLWSVVDFYKGIQILKEEGVGISYWSDEENWASLLFNEEAAGYMWKKYPLLIHNYLVRDIVINERLRLLEVFFLEVTSVKSAELSISDGKYDIELGGELNLTCFSAEDLWFSTNSI